MGSDKRQDAYEYLIDLAGKQGYVTFDDIMDCADERDLPIQDFDWLSGAITTRGIIVYDDLPENIAVDQDSDYDDYAHGDYDQVYDQIIELDPSLEELVTQVRNIIPPQRREFGTLIYLAKEGNTHARSRIIEMHLRVALKIALQSAVAYDQDIAETISDACIGLIQAVDKFNPDTHDTFHAYASMWILQSIRRHRPIKRPIIYYPVNVKELYYSAYPILEEYGYLSNNPRVEVKIEDVKFALKKGLNLTDRQIQVLLTEATPLDSIDDEAIQAEMENAAFYNIRPDGDPLKSIEGDDLKDTLHEVMSTLTQREREVITLRYGLDGGRERTLEEVGRRFGVTRERIRQIEAKSLKKFRHPSRTNKLRDYY